VLYLRHHITWLAFHEIMDACTIETLCRLLRLRAANYRKANHWFNCLVGSAVAASMQGVILPGIEGKAEVRKERMSFTEMQKRRRSK
jgi:hypothetical protein